MPALPDNNRLFLIERSRQPRILSRPPIPIFRPRQNRRPKLSRRLLQKTARGLAGSQQVFELPSQFLVVPAGVRDERGTFLSRFDFQSGIKQRIQIRSGLGHGRLRVLRMGNARMAGD